MAKEKSVYLKLSTYDAGFVISSEIGHVKDDLIIPYQVNHDTGEVMAILDRKAQIQVIKRLVSILEEV